MSVYEVANRFIEIYNNKSESLSHKKLQKLVYLAYGFYLVFGKKKLFDEKFEAWAHGPVCRELCYKIKAINNTDNVKNVLNVSNQSTENEDIINQMASYIDRHFGNIPEEKLFQIFKIRSSAWYKIHRDLRLVDIKIQDADIVYEIDFIYNFCKKAD